MEMVGRNRDDKAEEPDLLDLASSGRISNELHNIRVEVGPPQPASAAGLLCL